MQFGRINFAFYLCCYSYIKFDKEFSVDSLVDDHCSHFISKLSISWSVISFEHRVHVLYVICLNLLQKIIGIYYLLPFLDFFPLAIVFSFAFLALTSFFILGSTILYGPFTPAGLFIRFAATKNTSKIQFISAFSNNVIL